MKINAFLFDLDGVIVDTAVYHYQAWKQLANKLGFDIDEEFNETLKGISRVDSLKAILAHGEVRLTQEQFDYYATWKNTLYLELVESMTPADVLPGVSAFFADFKAKGIGCALGSASKNAVRILDKIGMLSQFDAIIDGNSVKNSKPDPEVFLKGAEALGVEATSCIVFEDAFAGLQAAKAANMFTVGIGDPDVLAIADVLIPSFSGFTTDELFTVLAQ